MLEKLQFLWNACMQRTVERPVFWNCFFFLISPSLIGSSSPSSCLLSAQLLSTIHQLAAAESFS